MATRIFGVGPNGQLDDVVEAIGPTATSSIIAIVVDLASNVNDNGGTRGPTKSELLLALSTLRAYIVQKNWPPA